MHDTPASASARPFARPSDDAPAITYLRTGQVLTCCDLNQDAGALAKALRRLGVKRGDPVAFRSHNGTGLYPLALACSQLGLSLVPAERTTPAGRAGATPRRAAMLVLCAASEAADAACDGALSLDELLVLGRAAAEPGSTDQAPGSSLAWSIRKLRTPLELLDLRDDAAEGPGEIVLHAGDGAELRTGDIGSLTANGGLIIAGKLSDVAIRSGRAILLSQVDVLIRQHPSVRSSVTFRERGASPAEPVVTVCETDLEVAELREWVVQHAPAAWVPDVVVTVPALPAAEGSGSLIPTLRAMVSGEVCSAVVTSMTARRFRRSPAHDEAALRAAVQAALMERRPLEFLMFWGCGPRSFAAAPDHMAIEALGELFAAAEAAAPVTMRADIIFTDGHATNNGYPKAHHRSYFASVERAAAKLNVAFHLESEVWQRAGLSKDMVSALEGTPEFEQAWEGFLLRDRFVLQASRHSSMASSVAAARHYYATCLLERDVLKTQFASSVFLTYNGPEFNECFPDLPTLYIYPGPRGRTDKPWFVHDGEDGLGLSPGLAVAAE